MPPKREIRNCMAPATLNPHFDPVVTVAGMNGDLAWHLGLARGQQRHHAGIRGTWVPRSVPGRGDANGVVPGRSACSSAARPDGQRVVRSRAFGARHS
jgi:hypothetical protein